MVKGDEAFGDGKGFFNGDLTDFLEFCTADACCPLWWHYFCHSEECMHEEDE